MRRDEWTHFYVGGATPDPSLNLPPGFVIPGVDPAAVAELLKGGVSAPAFAWNPSGGEKVLSALGNASGSEVMLADDFRQAMVTALFHAEQLAAAAGFSVAIPALDSSGLARPGFIVGAGVTRAQAAGPSNPAAVAYLEVHAAVKAAIDNSTAAPPTLPLTIGKENIQTIAGPVLVALVVVGIAALAAAAYVLTAKVEADASAMSRVKRASLAADLVMAGKKVPRGLLEQNGDSSGGPSVITTVVVAVVATVIAALAVDHFAGSHANGD